MKIVRFSFIA